VLTFIAPLQEGNYDFRMHNTDSSDGVEVASVSFTVQGSLLPQEASITLQKNVFAPGEEILVSFAAPPGFADNAWIGIIPSDVPHGRESVNDQHDISYLYLHKKTLGRTQVYGPIPGGFIRFPNAQHRQQRRGRGCIGFIHGFQVNIMDVRPAYLIN